MTHERPWQPLPCPTVRFNQFPESHRLRIVRNPFDTRQCSALGDSVFDQLDRGAWVVDLDHESLV